MSRVESLRACFPEGSKKASPENIVCLRHRLLEAHSLLAVLPRPANLEVIPGFCDILREGESNLLEER